MGQKLSDHLGIVRDERIIHFEYLRQNTLFFNKQNIFTINSLQSTYLISVRHLLLVPLITNNLLKFLLDVCQK